MKGVEHYNYENKRFFKSLHKAIKSKEKVDKISDNFKNNDIKDEQLKIMFGQSLEKIILVVSVLRMKI